MRNRDERRLQYDLTKGPVVNGILGFAVPLMISNLIQTTYNAVDMYFVGAGAGGTAGVSAVSVCGPMMNVMIVTLSGMSAGVTVVIGLAGRKEKAVRDRRCGKYSVYPLLSDGRRGYRCRIPACTAGIDACTDSAGGV